MIQTDTAAWVLNVIKMKKLLSRWAEHTVSSKLSNSMSRSRHYPRNFWRNQLWLLRRCAVIGGALVRRTHRALTLLREAEAHDKISSLLLEWRDHAYMDNLVSDDSNDEDYVPIRPKKKNKGYNYRCRHCGMKNDHYITTCPKKKAVQERNANFVIATFAAMGINVLD